MERINGKIKNGKKLLYLYNKNNCFPVYLIF